jgi:hypothetical protein
LAPWDEVHVDRIGPWMIKLPGQQEDLVSDALKCINPVTNIVEVIHMKSKTAGYIAMTMENNWLARYPTMDLSLSASSSKKCST